MADIHAAVVAKTGTIGKLPFSAVKDVLRAAGVGLIPDGRETLAKDVALTPGAATAGLNVRIRNSLGRR
jgi:hypothetical protein